MRGEYFYSLAVDIGKATPVTLAFSESLDASTVNGSNFLLYANGATIAPSVSRSGDSRTVTLTASLPAASVVSVIATSAVKDLSGNHLADYVASFSTAADAGTARPSVVTQYPGNGSTGILPDAKVVLYTDRPLDAATVGNASLHVSQNGVLVAGSLQLAGNNRAVEFTPALPLQKGALVQVFLDSNAKDATGNALNAYQGQFTTAADPATQNPTLVAYQPGYSQTGVPVNPVIDWQFSEALDPATVTAAGVILRNSNTGQVVPSAVSLIKGGRVVRLVPNANLAANTQYYRQIVGNSLRDLQGNAVGGYCCYYFTTGASADPDLTSPKVAAMSPGNGLEDVGINAHLHLRFDEPVNPLSLLPDDPDTTVRYAVSFNSGNTEVSYLPFAPYPASGTATEAVPAVQDQSGNVREAYSSTFKTGPEPDTAAPTVDGTNPYNNATGVAVNAVVTVRLNETIDPMSVNASSFYVSDNTTGQPVAGSRAVDADGRTLTFVPTQAWAVGRQFTLYVYGVSDLAGNNSSYSYYYFTTAMAADTVAPTVVQATVSDGQAGLPTNAVLSVRFSEPVDGLRLDGIVLARAGGAAVGVRKTLSGDHRTVTLTPLSPLSANAGYSLTVDGVADLSGNLLAAADVRGFTTGAGADGVVPSVTAWSPFSGATNVPLNAMLGATFGERIDPATLGGANLLYDSTAGVYVGGTLALSADGKTVILTPASPLLANRQYSLYFAYYNYGGIRDLAGNATGYNYISFTTGAAP